MKVKKIQGEIILIAIGLAVLYWIIDSAMMAFVFREGTFIEHMVTPGVDDIWMRSAVIGIIIAFGVYMQSVMIKRKRAEEILRETKEQYRDFFENAPIGFHILGPNKIITDINQAELDILGYSYDEIVGEKSWGDLIIPEHRQMFAKHWENMSKYGAVRDLEYTLVRKDGSHIFVLLNASAKFNSEGKIISTRGNVLDITERRQAEERLTEYSEKLEGMVDERTKNLQEAQEKLIIAERLATLGQVSGSISHELRNPLAVIDSSAYYLKRKLKDADKKTLEHLDRIKSSVDSSTTIIDSLFSLTRMKEPRLEKHDLVAITHNAIVTFELPATVNAITNFPDQEVLVGADQEQLHVAFQNIVKNAVEAMDDKGTLTVTIQAAADGQTEVSFTDTGPGIAPENLGKIFQPLFSTKVRGIGFGLAIVKMVIDKHGGTIEAQSKPGKGTIIIIRLPLYTSKDKEV